MQIKCIWDQPSQLGEGPLWHPGEQALYWVDIVEATLHRLDVRTGEHRSWLMPTEIGCIGLRAKGGLVAALKYGFASIELPSGKVSYINEPITEQDGVMFNDGKCDRRGRFWAGTKDIKESDPKGAVYRLDSNGKSHKMIERFTVTNGFGWNLDNTLLYVCDSPARKIYCYDFDQATGEITNQRPFATVPEDAGYPDGLTVDSKGYLWSAHWDGWRITRYDPEGNIDQVIPMPVQRPTSCCFGGSDLSTLYVTSARVRLSEAELAKGPLAGSLFAIDVMAQGVAEPAFLG